MKKVLRFFGSLVAVGALVSAVVYYLHKRGILRVEVNYDDKEGQPVTRELDEIVESAAGSVGERMSNKVTSVASDVKSRIEQQLGIVNGQLGGVTISQGEEYES